MPSKLWMSLLLLVATMETVSAETEARRIERLTEVIDRLCQPFSKALCPDKFPLERGSSCYSISVDFKNFADAKVACSNAGGKLAEIETAGENEFLKLYARLDGTAGYWIGSSDRTVVGSFRWESDGRPVTFTDWTPGQPDYPGIEDCVEIRVVSTFDSRWNNHLCGEHKRFICETNRF